MNLLSVNNLSKAYGTKELFTKISFGINYGEKVALVARNGSGKSTLFKILKGIEIPDEGEVVFRKDISIGFLDQDFTFDENATIQQLIDNADNKFVKCIRNYDAVIKASETSTSNDVADKLEESLNEMNLLGAWDYEKDIKEILSRLELHDTTRVVKTLSGGQKKRVALAKVLIGEPDFLILDEPTNHLDLDMIEWLEEYLSKSKSTILMVTHDRYFLEVVCDTILEMEDQTIYKYKGNFSYYLEKKAERQEQLGSTIDKARNTMRKELEWMRRQPKARGTKQKARVDSFQGLKEVASQHINEDELQLLLRDFSVEIESIRQV